MKTYSTISGIVIIFIIAFSCKPSFHDQYYKKIKGAWTIDDFEYIEISEDEIIDLRSQEEFFTIGFENDNHLWFTKRENRKTIFIRATYEILKENDTLKLRIEKSDDIRLEGVYDLYIDTLGQTDMHYRFNFPLIVKILT